MPGRAGRRARDAYIRITQRGGFACESTRAGNKAPMGRGTVAVVAAFAALAVTAPAHASSDPANVPWETFLPAMPSSAAVQPRSVPYCRKATGKCVDTEIKRLRRLQHSFGCEHRAVSATTYLTLTLQLRKTIRERPHFFRDPRYLYFEDALF